MTEQHNEGLAYVAARKWLTTKQVAEYLGVKDQTLRVWRHQGRGPLFHLIGRLVRYHIDELDDFVRGGPFGVQHSAPIRAAK